MSDDDRPDVAEGAGLDEARQARELGQALEGGAGDRSPELETAARIAAARAPQLTDAARDRLEAELFGEEPQRLPRWPLAAAAAVLIAAGTALVVAGRLGPRGGPVAEVGDSRREAETLLASLMPQPTPTARAEAIARAAAGRLQGGGP